MPLTIFGTSAPKAIMTGDNVNSSPNLIWKMQMTKLIDQLCQHDWTRSYQIGKVLFHWGHNYGL